MSGPATKPHVVVCMAMTADGKIAAAGGGSASFGGPRDHARLLELRAGADAVMSGARTVDSAPVNLGAGGEKYRRLRRKSGLAEENLRVVASGRGSISLAAEIFQWRLGPVIVLTSARASSRRREAIARAGAEVAVFGDKEIDFVAALGWLARARGVRRLVCEGGGVLNDAILRAGLADEIHLTICPLLYGGKAAPTISGGKGFASLAAAARFDLFSSKRRGDEMFLVYRRSSGGLASAGPAVSGSSAQRARSHKQSESRLR
jgi:riboflavin-specific deaminase-like protein